MRNTMMFVLVVCGLLALSSLAQPLPVEPPELSGTVAETMEGGRYTYLRVDTGEGASWVACSHLSVSVGDHVTVRGGTSMENFQSPTLNKTFDRILFAEDVQVGSGAEPPAMKLPPGHPPISNENPNDAPPSYSSAPMISGEIVETMDAGKYTYIRVRGSQRTVWAASEKFEARVGEQVSFPEGMKMKNFESPTLGRKFDEIYFVDYVETADSHVSSPHSAVAPSTVENEVVSPPQGGLTIAEVIQRRLELAGKEIVVKGKVVKYTERVMGRNWLHIVDGSGKGEGGDLTINTSDTTALGRVVTAKGLVVVDEDLGYGYKYSVLLKDATLSAE